MVGVTGQVPLDRETDRVEKVSEIVERVSRVR